MISSTRLRASLAPRSDRRGAARWSRVIAFVLALAIELLLLALLLRNRAEGPMVDASPRSIAFELTPDRAAPPNPATQHPAAPRPKANKLVEKTVPPVPPPILAPLVKPYVVLSKADLAAGDIGALPRRPGSGATGADGGTDGGAASARGDGPGGAHLYNAEWYVEPAHAALAPYIKGNVTPGSWATVACRTIERYHVENCVGLGESPPGSGLARALRLASWQFLVRPPRIDRRVLVGSWVRIRFDWTEEGGR